MAIKMDEEIESPIKEALLMIPISIPRSKKRLERSPTKPRRKSKRKYVGQRYEKIGYKRRF